MDDRFESLIQEAHEAYKQSVLAKKMTANIFARTFVAAHTLIDDDSVRNQNSHMAALTLVEILLTQRIDLLIHYFDKETLSEEMIKQIVYLVKTEKMVARSAVPNPLLCEFREDEWDIVTDCVNRAQLFVKKDLTVEQVQELFMCQLSAPLMANRLQSICYLFDQLNRYNFVGRWQTVLSQTRSIGSRRNKIITAGHYSSALSYCRRNERVPFKDVIDALIRFLNEKRSQREA